MSALPTATQFAWDCLGRPAFPPPEPRRGGRFGADAVCWLCGGPTGGAGWPKAVCLAPTFTNHNVAAAPGSDTICQACAYFGRGESWADYAAAHPDLGLKVGRPIGWRNYSHVFAAGRHACPTRATWKGWLLAPPPPPFLFVVAESGQKHLLFRARVAANAERYPVQVEEETLWVERAVLAAGVAAVEAGLAAGLARDEIATGRYAPHRLLALGPGPAAAIEAAIVPYRRRQPGLLRLACLVARKPVEVEEP